MHFGDLVCFLGEVCFASHAPPTKALMWIVSGQMLQVLLGKHGGSHP